MDVDILRPAFEPSKSALLICDMQNGFVKKSPPGPQPHVPRTIASNVSLLAGARSLGIPVAYTRRVYRRDGLDFSAVRKLRNVPTSRSYWEGTWDEEIIDELKPRAGELVIDKIRYSGFFQTPLETLLRSLGVTFLLCTGVATNWGVEASARDAEERDFIPIVVSDACGSGNEDLHEASLKNIARFIGFVVSTDEALALLDRSVTVTGM